MESSLNVNLFSLDGIRLLISMIVVDNKLSEMLVVKRDEDTPQKVFDIGIMQVLDIQVFLTNPSFHTIEVDDREGNLLHTLSLLGIFFFSHQLFILVHQLFA